jgi:SAM-dependent methyltransferase
MHEPGHEHSHGHGAGDRRRLAALLPFVREQIPRRSARVVEIGCGPIGGFVPDLTSDGHAVVGVDPEAPSEPAYRHMPFEEYDEIEPVDAVVACTSLHHVGDLDRVLDKVADMLVPGGVVVVFEWAHERFDEPTARWCFDRLPVADGEEGWLHVQRDAWLESGLDWNAYFGARVREEGFHQAGAIVGALDRRFSRRLLLPMAYYFADLAIAQAEEDAAIDAGLIRPNGVRYVGQLAT